MSNKLKVLGGGQNCENCEKLEESFRRVNFLKVQYFLFKISKVKIQTLDEEKVLRLSGWERDGLVRCPAHTIPLSLSLSLNLIHALSVCVCVWVCVGVGVCRKEEIVFADYVRAKARMSVKPKKLNFCHFHKKKKNSEEKFVKARTNNDWYKNIIILYI